MAFDAKRAEEQLEAAGWTKVRLSAEALGYTPAEPNQMYEVWIRSNVPHVRVEQEGWSYNQGGGVDSGDDNISLADFLETR
jgi:hypothetical protein